MCVGGTDQYGLSKVDLNKFVLDTAGIGDKCALGYNEFCHLLLRKKITKNIQNLTGNEFEKTSRLKRECTIL
jgi:hypothetical protein